MWPSVLLLVAACPKPVEPPPACGCPSDAGSAPGVDAGLATSAVDGGPSSATVPRQLGVCDVKGKLPLDAAAAAFDKGDYPTALACAARACAQSPDDVLAHTERGRALTELGQLDEAKQAFAHALAVDPDSLDALAGAAHLYALALPSGHENDGLGRLYAARGFELAHQADLREERRRFARMEAVALNDLGRSAEALERARDVLATDPKDEDARYEEALALFELCRFDEAKPALTALTSVERFAGPAHQHLGVLAEREGEAGLAKHHFAQARLAAPKEFPPPVVLDVGEFRALLAKVVAELPAELKKDLKGVPLEVEDFPALLDLTGDEPPLSPTILGLFRGPPLGERCEGDAGATPCRSIVVYRLNLARAVKTRAELEEQLRITLWHELGHLRGEDDDELAARGLQ